MTLQPQNLRLLLCLIVALAVHALVLPWAGVLLAGPSAALPQLRVEISGMPEEAAAGQVVAIEAVIRNTGTGSASGPWLDTIRLSRGTVPSEDDPLLWQATREAGLSPNSEYRLHAELTLDPAWDGPWFVIATADAEHHVPQADPTRTASSVRPIWIDAGRTPAIDVQKIDTPPVLAAGGWAAVEVTLENTGDGYARPTWADALYLSEDDQWSPEDLQLGRRSRITALEPGGAYTQRYSFPVPGTAQGEMFLIARTRGGVTSATPVEVESIGVPDLVVTSADVPSQIIAGQPTQIAFRVANHGSVGTGTVVWNDRVYLSMDAALDEDDIVLADAPNPLPLEPGERYRSDGHIITLDQPTQSTAYLIFVTDADNVVYEDRFEDNNKLVVPFTWMRAVESDDLRLGRDQPSPPLALAWISHEAFEELQARQSTVIQPALQTKMDPVADAPIVPDPAPPAVEARERADVDAPLLADQPPTPTTQTTPVLDAPPSDTVATPTTDAQLAADALGGQPSEPLEIGPGDQPLPMDRPLALRPDAREGSLDQPAGDSPQGRDRPSEGQNPEPTPSDQAADTDTPLPSPDPAPTPPTQTTRAPREGGTPTAAARSDREAPPVQLSPDMIEVQAGSVITVEGIEIKTAVPNFSAVARSSARPNSPRARVLFDKDGVVIDVQIIRSSGSDNVDGPVISSLYRWRASGRKLEQLDRPFVQEFTILLR